jgi:hypothetical protein
MKNSILALVSFMIMGTVTSFGKTVIIYDNHAPHKEAVAVHHANKLDKSDVRKKKAAMKKREKEMRKKKAAMQKMHKERVKAAKKAHKHNKKSCDCKKCTKWRKYHHKRGHRK